MFAKKKKDFFFKSSVCQKEKGFFFFLKRCCSKKHEQSKLDFELQKLIFAPSLAAVSLANNVTGVGYTRVEAIAECFLSVSIPLTTEKYK